MSRKRDIWNLTLLNTSEHKQFPIVINRRHFYKEKKNKTKEPDNADKEEQLDKVDEQAGEEEGDEKEDVNNL